MGHGHLCLRCARQTAQHRPPGRQLRSADNTSSYWTIAKPGKCGTLTEARRSSQYCLHLLGNTQIATRRRWASSTLSPCATSTRCTGQPVVDNDARPAPQVSIAPITHLTASHFRDHGRGTGTLGHVMDSDTGLTYMQQRIRSADWKVPLHRSSCSKCRRRLQIGTATRTTTPIVLQIRTGASLRAHIWKDPNAKKTDEEKRRNRPSHETKARFALLEWWRQCQGRSWSRWRRQEQRQMQQASPQAGWQAVPLPLQRPRLRSILGSPRP